HAAQAVVVLLPGQPFGRLVALVAARGGVPLGLGQLGDVDDRRHVLGADDLGGVEIGLAQRRVVPAAHRVEVVPHLAAGLALEAAQDRR
ncbi:hypothetical protein DF186_16880, partial [Enterococcus hirae]